MKSISSCFADLKAVFDLQSKLLEQTKLKVETLKKELSNEKAQNTALTFEMGTINKKLKVIGDFFDKK